MNDVVDLDGILVPADSIPAAKSDAAFFHGRGLYETLLAEAGLIAFGDLHFARMRASARINELPSLPDDAELSRRVDTLLRATGLYRARARINLRLDMSSLMVRAVAAAPDLDRQRLEGVAAITITCAEDDCHRARHKWLQRDTLLAARRQATEQGVGEALIFDPRGRLLEGASSSVFCILDGEMVTPATDDRILPGITRAVACSIATELDIATREESVSRPQLHEADEVFLTSAVRMLVPVIEIDSVPVAAKRPGPVSQRIAAELQRRAFGDQ